MTEEQIARYIKYFDNEDITYERKVEIVIAVSNIMQYFADNAFGETSVQLAMEAKKRG